VTLIIDDKWVLKDEKESGFWVLLGEKKLWGYRDRETVGMSGKM
jgi:hypothetical protein